MKNKTTKIISYILIIALVAGSISLVAIKSLGGRSRNKYVKEINEGKGKVEFYKKILDSDEVTNENLDIVNKAIKEAKDKAKKELTSDEIKLEAKKAVENSKVKAVINSDDKKKQENVQKQAINGVVKCGEEVVPNATIIIKKENLGIANRKTGEDGTFAINDVEVGECTVEATAEGYKVMEPAKVNIKKGMEAINLSLQKSEELKENEIEGTFTDGMSGGKITINIPEGTTVEKVVIDGKEGNPEEFDYAIKNNQLLVYAKVAATKVVVTINGVEKTVVVK
ncbi:carboxypeptidase-like regulatory domain-containing protein [Clostridium ihumii]|uniref:carboxypeptidase-like regulatory domain-containing protein n=1 Tax=Clostridium ihumii TaxID=1470356 RepID=UPI003D340C37